MSRGSTIVVLSLALAGASCGPEIGYLEVALDATEPMGSVGCVRFTAASMETTETVEQSFDVAGEAMPHSFLVGPVPVGAMRLSAVVFLGGACQTHPPSTHPAFVTPIVGLALKKKDKPPKVKMPVGPRSGKAAVEVDFVEEPACRQSEAPCLQDAECCSAHCAANHCQPL